MKRTPALILVLIFSSLLFLIVRATFASRALSTSPIASVRSGADATPQQPTAVSDNAWQQIQALELEKESRSPAQQKIDSQLLYATKMWRGQNIAPYVPTLVTDVGADRSGSVTVDITATIDDDLLRNLTNMGVEVESAFAEYHSLRVKTSLDQLESIANLPEVVFIQPKQEPTFYQATGVRSYPPATYDSKSRTEQLRLQLREALAPAVSPGASIKIGAATSEGDTTHRAFSARGTFNTDGTGIKIGVLSDGVTSLATSQASGDLGPVTILPGQGGSGDEGTAMLEIIHDLAPGAQLFFATADGGIANFAQNIRNLRSAGCDIILDDVGYFAESAFQDGQTSTVISNTNGGLATQAVNDVVASGALYFSAAANSGNKDDGTSGTWEGDFADGGTLPLVPGGKVHDFDPGTGISPFDTITVSGFLTNLYWSDPLGGSSNDYDLFILNSTGTAVVASSTNIQSGSQDPYEQVFSANFNDRVVILQKTGAANRFLHVSTNGGELTFNTQGDTHGHNAASGAYGVAAVCAICTFPSVFSSTNTVETFSSDGPRHIFFNGNSTAITPGDLSSTGGTVLQKPDITAADGVSVSGAGGFPTQFFGTSAAAPHAAAIAALLKSANPALTQAQIRTALRNTAIDIEAPGTDRDSGAGIVMPYAALQSLGPPVVGKAFLELSTISQTEISGNGNGIIDPGETGALTIALNNTGLLDATGINATLSSSTSGVTIMASSSSYPNLSPGGSSTSSMPFSLSLSSNFPEDSKINFTLTINYNGGHSPSQAWDFTLLIGINGSFETGDFSGWTVSTVSTGGSGFPFEAWTVSEACAGGFPSYGIVTTSPQVGVFDAWNGFDGGGPMEYRMYQDLTVPTGGMVNLSWKDRAQWNFCCGATIARTYSVQLRDPATNAVLATLYTFSTGTEGGYHDTGWLTHSSDLSAYIGQRVRVYFLEIIPEDFTGPGQLEFDAIRVGNGPPPAPTPTPMPSPGNPGFYGATREGQLFTINLNDGSGTLVGTLPGFGSTEIEYDNITRRAFTQFPDGAFEGQLFDINTGARTACPISDAGSFTGLEWVGPTLYGAMITSSHGASQLQTLDPVTGNSMLVGSTGIIDPIAGLAYDGTTMYGLTGGAHGGSSNLVTVDLTTGAATVIGSVGFNGGSLEFGPDGNLYAGSVGNTGNLYRINKSTGASTLVGATGFMNITGLTLVSPAPPSSVKFSSASYSVGESDGHVTITVTRSGDIFGAATVDYHTQDTDTFTAGCADTVNNLGSAFGRCDFVTVLGTLNFAAGEAMKSFDVPIIDDARHEGNETFNVVLSNPAGATLDSPATATVTIIDNDSVDAPNPILRTDNPGVAFFVRQHYLDFLGREPEAGEPWSAILRGCADQFNVDPNSPSAGCDRITVSGAFFGSPEFKDKGFYVIDFYRVAFGRLPQYSEFVTDVASLVGTTAQEVFARRAAYANNFVQRPEFATVAALPNSNYVMTLMAGTNGQNYNLTSITTPDPANPDGTTKVTLTTNDLINGLNANTWTKAQVLRAIVQSDEIINIEAVSTFVASQYYSYLRRTPEPAGFNAWVNYLTMHPTDFRTMVNGFENSIEYRLRFGPS